MKTKQAIRSEISKLKNDILILSKDMPEKAFYERQIVIKTLEWVLLAD